MTYCTTFLEGKFENKTKMKRILHCVSGFNYGGIEAMLLEYAKCLDPQKYQFDVLTFSADEIQKSKMEDLGGKVIVLHKEEYQNPITYIQSVCNILGSDNYCAVHSHLGYLSFLPLLAATYKKIPIRIAHAHAADSFRDISAKWKLAYMLSKVMNPLLVTQYAACSLLAGRAAFGNSRNLGNIRIIKNGIDTNLFRNVNQVQVGNLRRELDIPEHSYLVGNVGYVGYHKNQRFILEIAEALKEEDIYWILVGDGVKYDEYNQLIQKKGLFKVKMLGKRTDIPILMHLFDLFILPSIREGLGIVAIEAQASGTFCIISSNVPRDIDLDLNLVEFVPLDLAMWVNKILSKPKGKALSSDYIMNRFIRCKYDINYAVEELIHIYEE